LKQQAERHVKRIAATWKRKQAGTETTKEKWDVIEKNQHQTQTQPNNRRLPDLSAYCSGTKGHYPDTR